MNTENMDRSSRLFAAVVGVIIIINCYFGPICLNIGYSCVSAP